MKPFVVHHIRYFTQNKTFFSQSIIIEGSEKVLPQGNSKYKFEFSLPEDAKSSLKTDLASVSYTMECTADVIGLIMGTQIDIRYNR